MYLTADSVTIESDEMGFEIHIKGDEGPLAPLVINIHDCDLDAFYDQVKGRIGPYLLEMHEARLAVASGISREVFIGAAEEVIESGYAFNDPKHETYHDRMSEVWDNREKV